MPISTQSMACNRVSKTLIAEASDIGYNGVAQVLTVKSHKTGYELQFQLASVKRDEDNDITSWVFKITNASATRMPEMVGYQLEVFND